MRPTIIEFVTDPQLLGLSLFPAQETLLRAIRITGSATFGPMVARVLRGGMVPPGRTVGRSMDLFGWTVEGFSAV